MKKNRKPTESELRNLLLLKDACEVLRDRAKKEFEKKQFEFEEARLAYFLAYDKYHAKA